MSPAVSESLVLEAPCNEAWALADTLVSAVVLLPADSAAPLSAEGALPRDISAESIRPFVAEAFLDTPIPRQTARRAWLVLTIGTGQPLFLVAREVSKALQTGTPGCCLALCSPFPAFGMLDHMLEIAAGLVQSAGSLEEVAGVLSQLKRSVPAPQPGLAVSVGPSHGPRQALDPGFSWPRVDTFPVDASCIDVLGCLQPEAWVQAWEALLFEVPVVLVAENSTLLSRACVLLCSLLHPLRYAHACIPVVPPAVVDVLEAPFPFLLGFRSVFFRSVMSSVPSNALVLDLDRGDMEEPSDGYALQDTSLPPFLRAALVSDLASILARFRASQFQRCGLPAADLEEATTDMFRDFQLCFANTIANLLAPRFCPPTLTFLFRRRSEDQGTPRGEPPSGEEEFAPREEWFLKTYLGMGENVTAGVLKLHVRGARLPCWCEVDSQTLSIWNFADRAPIAVVKLEEVTGVIPSSTLPLGHCFVLSCSGEASSRICEACSLDQRQAWVTQLEAAARRRGGARAAPGQQQLREGEATGDREEEEMPGNQLRGSPSPPSPTQSRLSLAKEKPSQSRERLLRDSPWQGLTAIRRRLLSTQHVSALLSQLQISPSGSDAIEASIFNPLFVRDPDSCPIASLSAKETFACCKVLTAALETTAPASDGALYRQELATAMKDEQASGRPGEGSAEASDEVAWGDSPAQQLRFFERLLFLCDQASHAALPRALQHIDDHLGRQIGRLHTGIVPRASTPAVVADEGHQGKLPQDTAATLRFAFDLLSSFSTSPSDLASSLETTLDRLRSWSKTPKAATGTEGLEGSTAALLSLQATLDNSGTVGVGETVALVGRSWCAARLQRRRILARLFYHMVDEAGGKHLLLQPLLDRVKDLGPLWVAEASVMWVSSSLVLAERQQDSSAPSLFMARQNYFANTADVLNVSYSASTNGGAPSSGRRWRSNLFTCSPKDFVADALAQLITLFYFHASSNSGKPKSATEQRKVALDKSSAEQSTLGGAQVAPSGEQTAASATCFQKLVISVPLLAAVRQGSGFAVLVDQLSELQAPAVEEWLLNPNTTEAEKLVFLLNLHNLMTLHGLVVFGIPSSSFSILIARYKFQSGVRYALGSMVLSLVQVEHALLRANLSPVTLSLIGSVGSVSRKFPPSDKRSKLELQSPTKLVSFGLCSCTASSPPLFVFRDPKNIGLHLSVLAAMYLRESFAVDCERKTVVISEYLQWFWKDFGRTRHGALQTWFMLQDTASRNAQACSILGSATIQVSKYKWATCMQYVSEIK